MAHQHERECAVCTNDFTTPKILPCGHLLCRECVITWMDSKRDAGCPLCRCPIVEQSDGSLSDTVDALPTDFVMEALVESARVLSKDHLCCVCEDVRADFICMQCQDMLCSACTKVHSNLPATRSHDVESVSTVTPERLAASRPALCADHGDKQAEFFCREHRLVVCQFCLIKKHTVCPEVNCLDNEIQSAQKSLNDLTKILVEAEQKLEQAIRQVTSRLQEVDVSEQKDMAQVDKTCGRLQKLVEDFRGKLKDKTRTSHLKVRNSLRDVKTDLIQRVGKVTSHKHIVTRLIAVSPRPALINMTQSLRDRVSGLDLSSDLPGEVWTQPLSSVGCWEENIWLIEKELLMSEEQKTETKSSLSSCSIEVEKAVKKRQGIPTDEEESADDKSKENSEKECGVKSEEEFKEESQKDEKKHVEEMQERERREIEASATFNDKRADDTEIQIRKSLLTGPECFSFPYKITLDLTETVALTSSQDIIRSSCSRADCGPEEAADKWENIFSSPIFCDHWEDCASFTAAGGRLQKQGSDVVLQVPEGAVEGNTRVTLYAAVCTDDMYIKHKLNLPASKTIVSPLAEFWAGPEFQFQKHVQITLPTCLPSDHDVNLLHVYCITFEKPEGELRISELERLDKPLYNPNSKVPAAYFQVNENGQVQVMTTHFSCYVCTSCHQFQSLPLEVYASHKHQTGAVQVSVIAHLWDKLCIPDFRKWGPGFSSYQMVLRDTIPLRKVFTPAELNVELIISNDQKTAWQHVQFDNVSAQSNKAFPLECDKIQCHQEKCREQAVKYTNLGPFSACWMLKSEDRPLPPTLDICVCVSHMQVQGDMKPDSSSAPIQIDVQQQAEAKNRNPCDRMTISIQNVDGDVNISNREVEK